MNRKTRGGAATHRMGETRGDAGNADADLPFPERPPAQGEEESDLPDPSPEERKSGEGPALDEDDGEGLGPPSGHGE